LQPIVTQFDVPADLRLLVDAPLQRERRGTPERRRTERPQAASDRRRREPARLLRRADLPVFSYRCPQHGMVHEVAVRRGFARSYFAALSDEDCLCPGREPWYVRQGIGRRSVMLVALLALWAFNVCDFLLTTASLRAGVAVEANGLMAVLLRAGPLPALAFKIGVVTLGAALLWRLRRHRLTITASMILAALYAAVVLYQVVWSLWIV
jgi:hypothetical protein